MVSLSPGSPLLVAALSPRALLSPAACACPLGPLLLTLTCTPPSLGSCRHTFCVATNARGPSLCTLRGLHLLLCACSLPAPGFACFDDYLIRRLVPFRLPTGLSRMRCYARRFAPLALSLWFLRRSGLLRVTPRLRVPPLRLATPTVLAGLLYHAVPHLLVRSRTRFVPRLPCPPLSVVVPPSSCFTSLVCSWFFARTPRARYRHPGGCFPSDDSRLPAARSRSP